MKSTSRAIQHPCLKLEKPLQRSEFKTWGWISLYVQPLWLLREPQMHNFCSSTCSYSPRFSKLTYWVVLLPNTCNVPDAVYVQRHQGHDVSSLLGSEFCGGLQKTNCWVKNRIHSPLSASWTLFFSSPCICSKTEAGGRDTCEQRVKKLGW